MRNKIKLMMFGAVLCTALFIYSGVMLHLEYLEEKQSVESVYDVAALVKENVDLSSQEDVNNLDKEAQGRTTFEKYADIYVQNNDFIGWISIPDTRINYPVMQTKESPNFYLDHAFDKSENRYGVPYAQEDCDIGLSDNLIVYGHYMKNGSMFTDLREYECEDFYQDHKIIQFDTLDRLGKYEVIAVFKTVAYSAEGFKYYNFVNAEDAAEFDAYIDKCKELALYETGVTAEYGDRLLTLSTCEFSRKNGRLVVVAKLIEE